MPHSQVSDPRSRLAFNHAMLIALGARGNTSDMSEQSMNPDIIAQDITCTRHWRRNINVDTSTSQGAPGRLVYIRISALSTQFLPSCSPALALGGECKEIYRREDCVVSLRLRLPAPRQLAGGVSVCTQRATVKEGETWVGLPAVVGQIAPTPCSPHAACTCCIPRNSPSCFLATSHLIHPLRIDY